MIWRGSDASLPGVLLNSHTDVVPVSPKHWTHDPFAAEMDERGVIYARGSQDMKCVGMAQYFSVRRLKEAGFVPQRNVYLSFVPDEEIGGHDGMAQFVKSDEFKGLHVGVCLDEGFPSFLPTLMTFNDERVPLCIICVLFNHCRDQDHGTGASRPR